jgi:hypothetical protein
LGHGCTELQRAAESAPDLPSSSQVGADGCWEAVQAWFKAVEDVAGGHRGAGLAASEAGDGCSNVSRELGVDVLEVGIGVHHTYAEVGKFLDWETSHVAGDERIDVGGHRGGAVHVVVGIRPRHGVDEMAVDRRSIRRSSNASRIAAVTEAALAALRSCSRTITRSHSSSSSSVHNTWRRPFSVSARNRSITENGNKTLVSTKNRRTVSRAALHQ